MNKKRDQLEIIHDMLLVMRDSRREVKPTHVMYKANLSHQMLNEYMEQLISKGFAEEKENKGKKSYAITSKGLKYLEDYSVIRGFVDSYGLY